MIPRSVDYRVRHGTAPALPGKNKCSENYVVISKDEMGILTLCNYPAGYYEKDSRHSEEKKIDENVGVKLFKW